MPYDDILSISDTEAGTHSLRLDGREWPVPSFSQASPTVVTAIHAWSGALIDEGSGFANHVWSHGSHQLQVHFQRQGSSRNSIYIHSAEAISGFVGVTGSGNRVILCGSCPWPSTLRVHICGNNNTLYIGPGCTFNGTDMFVTGDDISIVCGENCMFSHATMIRTYDQHAIFDIDTHAWINKPESVLIERHVWIGQEVLILKGSIVGQGAIVGARSTVTSYLPSMTLSLGTPARVVKSKVSWVRDLEPTGTGIAEVMAGLAPRGDVGA